MPLEKRRILLVDDEPSIIKMVGRRLEVEGYEVLVAMDGQEALIKARGESPSLVILDLMLPKINGYEVCTALKHNPNTQKIPVVMLTSKSQGKDEELGMECGANVYMRKPFKAQELLDRIKVLLERS